MEILYDLAQQNLKSKRVLGALLRGKSDSPLVKLYNILFSETRLTDHEVMMIIYGRRCASTLSMLKIRMKEILIRAIITQVPRDKIYEARHSAILNVEKVFIAFRHILQEGNRKLAINLLEGELKTAIKYHFTEDVLRYLRNLILHYGATEYNKYKLQKYSTLQTKYLKILQFEEKVINYYIETQKIQMHSLANISKEDKVRVSNYVKELKGVQELQSSVFNYFKFRVLATHYEFESDYDSLLKLCNQAENELNKDEFKSKLNNTHIILIKEFALLQTGKFQDCILLGKKEMKENAPGRIVWYLLGYYTLKAMLYDSKYENAIEFINLLINQPGYKKLSEGHKELIFVNLGYIHLILGSGLIKESKKLKDQLPEFRIAKFLNTARVFNKDKRGINVSILLLEIAFLLQRKKYDVIIDRIESLQKYTYRYLRKDDTFRSNCMIKLVIQMTKSDFHPVRTRRLTQDLRKKLSDVKLQGSGSNIDIEVIPFEVLWDIMLKAL